MSGVRGSRLVELWYAPNPRLGQRLLRGALAPASWAFGAASALRRRAYAAGLMRQHRAPFPVVSVGNLTVGGAGKTPVVAELARRLGARGLKVAILARGYRGQGRGPRLVSDGRTLCAEADRVGDEPRLLAERLPGVAVLVGPRRRVLAERAAQELGTEVAILDDGLQHLALARDLEVVVVDAARRLGNGALLPRGPLREGPEALDRAHLLWISKVDEAESEEALEAWVDSLLDGRPCAVVLSRYRPARLLLRGESAPLEALAGRRVLALCGIAHPASFVASLRRIGAEVAGTLAYPDHHRYRPAEIEAALAEAAQAGALLVTTEKDAVRLPASARARLAVLGVETEIVAGGAAVEAALDRLVGRRRPAGKGEAGSPERAGAEGVR